MGTQALDQYSFLHFSTGVIAYFFNVPLWVWFIINIIFEIFENSVFGMRILDNLSFYPGVESGIPLKPEIKINIVCDVLCCILGWCVAYCVDYLGKKYLWYNPRNL